MTDRVQKFIETLDKKTRLQLKTKLLALKKDPFSAKNVKALKGYGTNMFRLRMGKIRVIYYINKDQSAEILDIDYRGEIYKKRIH